MKASLYLLTLLVLFSCSNSSDDNASNYSTMSFSIDTVIVDAGDDIINLSNGIWQSTMSSDNSILYNFSHETNQLEKIDLNTLALSEKIHFEKEGPNGTGSYVFTVNMDKENNLFLSNFEQTGVFNLQGEKLRGYQFRNEKFEGDSLRESEEFSSDFLVTDDNTLLGLISSWTKNGYALGVLDYENKFLKRHELKDYERTQDYHIMLRSGNGMSIRTQSVKIQEHKGKYLISNSIFNTLALYDHLTDSLIYISYDSQLTENSKTGKYRTEVESQEEFRSEITRMGQEINFMVPLWDEQNGRFYRFSYKEKPKVNFSDETEQTKADVYLTVLDGNFKVLGESKVDILDRRPAKHFVKDGKIWIYENIDDELGFVRLSLN